MDENKEIIDARLNEIAGGESDETDLIYYCETCSKAMSYKVANEHKAKGHKVILLLPPCEN